MKLILPCSYFDHSHGLVLDQGVLLKVMASVGHRVSLWVNHGVGHGVIPEDVCGHHLKICLSPHNCYKL